MGRQVEQLRRFLDLFLGSGEPSRHPPLRMVLFRKTRHFAPYVPQRGDDAGPLGGWYASTPQGDFMAVDANLCGCRRVWRRSSLRSGSTMGRPKWAERFPGT